MVLEFDAERFLDLVEFVLNCRVGEIAICMVLPENVESFFVATFRDKPARRLWNEKDEDQLNDRRKGLA